MSPPLLTSATMVGPVRPVGGDRQAGPLACVQNGWLGAPIGPYPSAYLLQYQTDRATPSIRRRLVLGLAGLAVGLPPNRGYDHRRQAAELLSQDGLPSTRARIIVIAERLIRPAVVTIATPLIRVIIFSRSALGRFASLSSVETLRDLVDHI